MIGFIKKDLFMIKANLKTFLIIFVLYLILAIQGSFDITMVLHYYYCIKYSNFNGFLESNV